MNTSVLIISSFVLPILGWLLFVMVRLGFVARVCILFRWNRRVDRILEFARDNYGSRALIELLKPMSWNDRCCWSAEQLLEAVRQIAACWQHLGVGVGDRIAVYKENSFDYFILCCSAIRVGAIAVPINGSLDADIAARYMARLGVRILVGDSRSLDALRGKIPDCVMHVISTDFSNSDVMSLSELIASADSGMPVDPAVADRPIYVVHTSGTTGIPKGVIIKVSGLIQSLRSMILFNMVSSRDTALFALPMNHQVAHLYLNGALLMGVHCTIHHDPRDPNMASCIERIMPSVFFSFPVTYTIMKREGVRQYSFDSIRIWGSTADACHESLKRPLVARGSFFREIGLPVDGSIFVDGLGSSEVSIAALLHITTPWTRYFGRRVGRETPLGPEVKVADVYGNRVADGCVGLLMVRGDSVFCGYWNAHETYYQAMIGDWFITGDVVLKLPGGEYMHLDRAVDVIQTVSGPVYTLPIEEILLNRPGILDVAVFGVRAQKHGVENGVITEVPIAVVVFEDENAISDSAELLAEVNVLLESHEKLRDIQVLKWQDLPLGSTGKTLKRVLRTKYESNLTG